MGKKHKKKEKAIQKNRQREESLAKVLLLTALVELIEKIINLIEKLIK